MLKNLYRIFLISFIGLIMIDPTNMIFHQKEILFAGLIACALLTGELKFYKDQTLYSITLLFLAFASIAMGNIIYGENIQNSSHYFKSIIFVTIAFTMSRLSVEVLLKYLYYIGMCLSGYIVLLYISYMTQLINLNSLIDTATDANRTIMIAWRQFLGIDMIMFFYKSMPFCFFSLAYALRKNNIIAASLIAFSIAIGGSRTPILMGLLIIVYIYSSKSKHLFKYLIPILLSSVLIYLVVNLLAVENRNYGDEIKFTTVYDLLGSSSFWGHGVGTSYSTSVRGIVHNSEMTYFEMIYHYGWLLSPIVFFIFFSPVFIIYKKAQDINTKDFAIAYFAYLINAGTNPLLINSTGMFVFACAITILAKVNEQYRKGNKRILIKNDSRIISNL